MIGFDVFFCQGKMNTFNERYEREQRRRTSEGKRIEMRDEDYKFERR